MRFVAKVFSGPVMFVAGINHFVMTDAYVSIVPARAPAPRALVYVSGVAEMLAALGTLHPRTRRPAGWALIAILVAVFPANVHMALNADRFAGVPGGELTLLARLPLQILFVYWVWLATLSEEADGTSGTKGPAPSRWRS